eukprot:g11220.t1 g11220   contig5:396388-396957(-)
MKEETPSLFQQLTNQVYQMLDYTCATPSTTVAESSAITHRAKSTNAVCNDRQYFPDEENSNTPRLDVMMSALTDDYLKSASRSLRPIHPYNVKQADSPGEIETKIVSPKNEEMMNQALHQLATQPKNDKKKHNGNKGLGKLKSGFRLLSKQKSHANTCVGSPRSGVTKNRSLFRKRMEKGCRASVEFVV